MIIKPTNLPEDGALRGVANRINRLQEHVMTLRPVVSRGVLTSHTMSGVTRTMTSDAKRASDIVPRWG